MQTVRVRIKVKNRLGLHARPAMAFVDAANRHECEIRVKKNDQVVDGKSIMQMMMLAATQGTVLEIEATGTDAKQAIEALTELFDRKFDEQ